VAAPSSTAGASDSALWQIFKDLVAWACEQHASDLHVNVQPARPRSQVRFTIAGKYVAPPRWLLPSVTLQQMLGVAYQRGKGGAETVFMPTREQQCNITLTVDTRDGRSVPVMLRWASMATDDGPQVTLRLLHLEAMQQLPSLQSLGYLPSQVQMLRRAQCCEGGAIILSGVVGSGKSTTLATLMCAIPDTRKVVTLEDPREYIIPNAHANTVARPLDGHADEAFRAKLLALKRSAFNDLLLGEIRDRQTGLVFQDVVQSGQSLYATTHARRATGIFDKLASPLVGVDREVLSTPGVVKLAVYQALLPLNCPHCALQLDGLQDRSAEANRVAVLAQRIARLYGIEPGRLRFRNPKGCAICRREGLPELDGFLGRTVAAEMLEPDEQMLEFVRQGNALQLQRHASALPRSDCDDADMRGKSALECAVYKMGRGEIDPRELESRFAPFDLVEQRRARRPSAGQDDSGLRVGWRAPRVTRSLPNRLAAAALRRSRPRAMPPSDLPAAGLHAPAEDAADLGRASGHA
jgi:type II secretory ATPase GspE/PulE/Tfp pilus assembly ATPase PilB-like protein